MIAAFNGFNLLAPFWIVPAFEARLHVSLASWQFLLWDFPLAFSALFFAVPAGRWIKARLEERRRRVRNDRRRLLGGIFAGAGPRPREELAPTPGARRPPRSRAGVAGRRHRRGARRARPRSLHLPAHRRGGRRGGRARGPPPPAVEQDAGLVVFSSAD